VLLPRSRVHDPGDHHGNDRQDQSQLDAPLQHDRIVRIDAADGVGPGDAEGGHDCGQSSHGEGVRQNPDGGWTFPADALCFSCSEFGLPALSFLAALDPLLIPPAWNDRIAVAAVTDRRS
jgi:hypothetical protein